MAVCVRVESMLSRLELSRGVGEGVGWPTGKGRTYLPTYILRWPLFVLELGFKLLSF